MRKGYKISIFKPNKATKNIENENSVAKILERGEDLPLRLILPIFGALILSMVMAALDQTIVSTALPTIAGELHGLNNIGWLITAYLLAQTVSVPIYGKVGDEFGRKRVLQFAICVFLLGSVLSGLAQSMNMLITFRALQGLGAGGLIISAQSIIADVVPARKRGKYLGFLMPIFGLATAFGPTLGGLLLESTSWRWIFYINIPIGIAALIAVQKKINLPLKSPKGVKLDYKGAALLAITAASLVLFASWGGTRYAWDSFQIIGLAILAVVAAFLWYQVEKRAEDPIIPTELFKNKIFLSTIGLGAMLGLGLFGAISFLPTFLQIVHGASATMSGILMLPFSAGMMVSAVITGQLVSKTGHYKTFPILSAVVGGTGMYLLSTISAATPAWVLDSYMVVLGVGIGMVMPILTLVVQNAVKQRNIGVATAGVNFFRQIGGALGVSIAGTLFTTRLHDNIAKSMSPSQLAHANIQGQVDPSVINQLPHHLHQIIVNAYGTALPSIFLDFVPVFAVAFVIAWLLPEIKLATHVRSAQPSYEKQSQVQQD